MRLPNEERRPVLQHADGEVNPNQLSNCTPRLPDYDGASKFLVRFLQALGCCPEPGRGVHSWMMGAANLGARAVVEQILRVMPREPSPPDEVWRTVRKAFDELAPDLPRLSKPVPVWTSAAPFLQRGAGATAETLRSSSPVHIPADDDGREAACAVLRACFRPGELVFCGTRFDTMVLPRDEWIGRFMGGDPIPPLFCANPLKAGGGITKTGTPSSRCDDAVADFRHAVLEFDAMPLSDQFALLVGLGLDAVSAVTFSGGKSLHALLRVDVPDKGAWDRDVRLELFSKRFIPLGCDGSCQNPSRLTRLAGAQRADKANCVQELYFVKGAM